MSLSIDEITAQVIDVAIKVHSSFGPGLFESVYDDVVAAALERLGLSVVRQCIVPFEFEGQRFDRGLRLDLLVDDCVIVEIKSIERIAPVHFKQVLTYLRLLDLPVGLLLNFGCATLKDGLHRIVNNYDPSKPVKRLGERGVIPTHSAGLR